MTPKTRIALVGLGFGAEFIPIYQQHPHAELTAICQRNKNTLNQTGDAFDVGRRYTSYGDLLADPEIDAIHINTPIPDHAAMTIAGLEAGKHVACTVPMATTLEDCEKVVNAANRSGKNYMMMETVVYSREYLFVKELLNSGQLGRLQFLRGAHMQDMAGWPGYWEGLPPMHYATHAVSPLLALSETRAESVVCVGSGRIPETLAAKYGSPFAVESALVKLAGSDLSAEITRSLFETSRQYVESFSVYGSRTSFEWGQTRNDEPVLFRGEDSQRVQVPDFAHLLPEAIQPFTTKGVYDSANAHLSFKQGSGHGGSHPHLAHEFIQSIQENRRPAIDQITAANWTAVGLCAHESALKGGQRVDIPGYASP
ncbi:Gfo/Idh/MocA family protein [Pseudarthrobacter sp. NamB4]|uniref:Gfo/Idh/MocA family protein n=1 Tax=Pseudarthrobacter sp. NamB4 TaxID=2576837 RepID=UPI0010FDC0E8|nr:Gfo/Idh/MocA family oxidoreductase [Pseudarthrobacter sp. NamB4]TLM70522.1 Gfo/Idh/MocA family oxidoreductase [Pseudarthrobacter sp. NamB4]